MDQQAPLHPPDDAPPPLEHSLPEGWRLLATAPGLPCHVLVHAGQGVILLDLEPGGTPGVEGQLGRAMGEARLRGERGPPVPVWYVQLEPGQLARFAGLLAAALAGQPAQAALPRGWTERLHRALLRDPAWSPAPRGVRPGAATWAGILAATACSILAFTVVMLWQGREAAAPVASAVEAVPAAAETARGPDTAGPPSQDAAAESRAPTGTARAGNATPTSPDATASQAAPAVETASRAMPSGETASHTMPVLEATESQPQPSLETTGRDMNGPDAGPGQAASEPALPEHPPVVAEPAPSQRLPAVAATATPPRAAPRPPRRTVDPHCVNAQFRWAQGERLSWGEMAYVRNGCSPQRR